MNNSSNKFKIKKWNTRPSGPGTFNARIIQSTANEDWYNPDTLLQYGSTQNSVKYTDCSPG